ncbi:MAG: hypothetical protein M1815_000369 [Lichina confinis]|nr:MAG: hypothetical protein M1815_000369 [Lichina confinis]
MQFEDLPTELVLHVFQFCASVQDVLNLALTCSRFRKICGPSQKLPILAGALEAEFGPLEDAIQVVTQNDSQPAHLRRRVPLSISLFRQLLALGRVATKWEDVYPVKKWKLNYEDRRLLTSQERYCLRRAIYRIWLYDKAFHNRNHPRFSRLHQPVVLERAALLHNWMTTELGEIEDVRDVLREVLENHICPSNGTVQRKFRKRFPEPEHQLTFNIHLNYPPPPSSLSSSSPTPFQQHFHTTHQLTPSNKFHSKYVPATGHEPGAEGWGDEIPHYYVVEDMLKLDPGQIIWLRENAPLKGQVESFVRGLGLGLGLGGDDDDWFENNGETLGQTIALVLHDRGGVELSQLKADIDAGEAGIAIAVTRA